MKRSKRLLSGVAAFTRRFTEMPIFVQAGLPLIAQRRSRSPAQVASAALLITSACCHTAAQLNNAQPGTQPGIPVRTDGLAPDRVATSLMPVPIYNFAVHNVAFSPDGKLVATGNGYGIVRLWNTRTGTLEHTIQAHDRWAFSVAWSPDGQFFVTGGGDSKARMYEAKNPATPIKTFIGHQKDVHTVVISPDSRHIVSAGDDRRIIIWNAETGKPERDWIAHDKQIPTLAISPDGKVLASGSRDDSIRLWSLETGELRDTLIGHADNVMAVRFSPDGKTLASAGYDHTVRLWSAETGKAIRILKGHTNRVFSVAFSPDGKRLASVGDSSLRIWDAQTGYLQHLLTLGGMIQTPQGTVAENLSCVAFSPDGTTLAVASTTGISFLLSSTDGHLLRKLEPERPPADGAPKDNGPATGIPK